LATSKDRAATTRLVFVSVLPLFGTWVGTVLAFYFAGRNLEAATASTRSLSEVTARLAGVTAAEALVSEKMIPRAQMRVLTLTAEEDAGFNNLPLSRLWDELEAISFDRLPIVGPDRAIRAVVHRSLLTSYAAGQAEALPDCLEGKTINDLSEEEQRMLKTFALVAANATLGEARNRMRAVKDANDVFVTETGAEAEPVVGWLTNTDLAEIPD
jgi:hypothetical protein